MITRETYPIEGFTKIRNLARSCAYYFACDIQENEEQGTLDCEIRTLIVKDATYDKLVSAAIESKYDINAQMALLYNYQQDADKYANEMQEYQEWRTYCKDACREYFGLTD